MLLSPYYFAEHSSKSIADEKGEVLENYPTGTAKEDKPKSGVTDTVNEEQCEQSESSKNLKLVLICNL